MPEDLDDCVESINTRWKGILSREFEASEKIEGGHALRARFLDDKEEVDVVALRTLCRLLMKKIRWTPLNCLHQERRMRRVRHKTTERPM